MIATDGEPSTRAAVAAGPPPRAHRFVGPVTAGLLVLLGVLSYLAFAPPSARDAGAPREEFSAARALVHLREIAQRPHATGSADNARVREYLVATARELGARVRVESAPVVRPDWGNPFPAATVHNVVAEIPGTGPGTSGGKAVLLVAHYDSVPTGPGAADNGAAVAAMLETMRALSAGGGVPNDVVFLFTDGEEIGALGAQSFVNRNDLGEYGVVLNWEARGSHGPVMMFETSAGNAALIDAFAATGSRPVANSMAYEVYKRMPNGTDFTVFRDAGATGLNAAFLEGFHEYHSVRDSVDSLSRDSVQHHGETMLGMVRALGVTDLRSLASADAVYFDLFARALVHYPAGWALPLALLTLLGLAALIAVGAHRSRLRYTRLLAVAGTGLAVVVVSAALVLGLWLAVVTIRPGLAALPLSEPYDRGLFGSGFCLVAAAVLLGAGRLLRRLRPAEIISGTLALGGVLLLIVVLTVPGASYLFQWPLLAGLPALWMAVRRDVWWQPALSALAPAVAVVLFVPLVVSLFTALGIPLGAVAVAVAALAGVLLLPLVRRPGRSAVTAAVLALALVGAGVVASGFTAGQPRPNALLYVQDPASGGSRWFSPGPGPDEWTRRVLGDGPSRADGALYFPEQDEQDGWAAPAPDLKLPEPEVRTVADRTDGDVRTLTFGVRSVRDAWRLQVRLPREPVRACTVAGVRMDAATLAEDIEDTRDIVLHYTGAGGEIEISCEIRAGTPLPVDVTDFSPGLPGAAEALVGPRPDTTVPIAFGFAPDDAAVVRRITTL
ncbi:putative M28-family peptidase [Actinoplanes missouriensis 431]|uniref:Vacuolar membrane protease n=2 Tax=Actinoplanes missouriensis TaxID=1866 RepID=I0HB00_ACTM4|nr:putative M28-family peptidase [Actinoplanes missouriensis 431]